MNDVDPKEALKTEWEKSQIKTAGVFLTEEDYRFQFINDECVELYLQGKNLVMRILAYFHNRHLIMRVPAFVRNVELRKPEILLAILGMMNEYLDIRYEISEDGQNLSGAINHIVEDGVLTKAQFFQCLNVLAFMVDESYPKFMKLIYGSNDPKPEKGGSGERKASAGRSGSNRKTEDKALPLAEPDTDKTKIN